MKSRTSKIHNLKLQIAQLQERLEALEKPHNLGSSTWAAKPTGTARFDFTIEFDGGTSCNNPAKGYGKGYGSFQIGDMAIERVEFGMGHSCNSAEINTLVSALTALVLQIGDADKCKTTAVLVRGDSKIALKWVRCRQTPSPKTSLEFQKSICALHRVVKNFARIETQWRGRAKSVEIFGH